MPLLRRTLLASLTTLAIAGPAHAAEQVYTCDGGAFLTVNAYEARVSLSNSDGFAIAMPFIGEWDHYRIWSPRTEPGSSSPKRKSKSPSLWDSLSSKRRKGSVRTSRSATVPSGERSRRTGSNSGVFAR